MDHFLTETEAASKLTCVSVSAHIHQRVYLNIICMGVLHGGAEINTLLQWANYNLQQECSVQ